jgi:glycosyltransferase involved in cell wall biosynthesis
MTSDMIKIAIPQIGSSAWTGGITYQNNLMFALSHFAPHIEVMEIISDAERAVPEWKAKIITLLRKSHSLLPEKLADFFYGHYKHATSSIKPTTDVIDAVFSLGYYDKNVQVANLAWIPDFQHVHLPEMFTEQELTARDNGYRYIAKNSTLVVLSSKNALKDFREFSPEYAQKGRVMQFVAHVPAGIYDNDPSDVCGTYKLPDKFIYLPNQFWKHKNHFLVLDALKLMKDKGITPHLVLTGNIADHRNPDFFKSLKDRISSFGIESQISILGLIPHEDVYKLIRQAAFILNPSLFEGWSTTVEETKSVGKKILLSDIEVHVEQAPPKALYFNPKDAADLAEKLDDMWNSSSAGPDRELEQQARDQFPARMKQFADTFTEITKEAIALIK